MYAMSTLICRKETEYKIIILNYDACYNILSWNRGEIMRGKPIRISLSDSETTFLLNIISTQQDNPRAVLRAQILLMSNQQAHNLASTELAQILQTSHTTVQTTRHDYLNGGVEEAVFRKKRTIYPTTCKITDLVKQQIKALYQEEPPHGKNKWSLSMLCKACEERGIIKSISTTSIMKILRETTVKDNDH